MTQLSGELSFEPFTCPSNLLVTARSHLVDRFVPDIEVITLPEKPAGGGTLRYSQQTIVSRSSLPEGRGFPFRGKTSGPVRIDGRIIFDFRLRTPQNWAHFLNNHLPILFAITNETTLSPEDITIVLPEKTPGHILGAAELFGLQTLCTNAPVDGNAIVFDAAPWTGIRSVRAEWARLPFVRRLLDVADITGGSVSDLPKRAFLSRRNTRCLENEAEVEACLGSRGYMKIYPEDLSVADQFRLFEKAEHIVAIHGAALAPLLYRSAQARLRALIELFPCGHMTDVYRVMSHQVGCRWIGVRGKIKPEHVGPAYDLSQPFLKYSLQSFEVDTASLEMALELIGKNDA